MALVHLFSTNVVMLTSLTAIRAVKDPTENQLYLLIDIARYNLVKTFPLRLYSDNYHVSFGMFQANPYDMKIVSRYIFSLKAPQNWILVANFELTEQLQPTNGLKSIDT